MSNNLEIATFSEKNGVKTNFTLRCTLDKKNEITNLALDNIVLISNGQISDEKHLNPSAIKIYKKDLETEFEKSFPNYKNFTIESIRGEVKLKPSGLRKIVPFSSSIKLDSKVANKILKIQDQFLSNKIFGKTSVHNIKQLKATTKTNQILSIALLSILTLGILAGFIGLGSLMPIIGGTIAAYGIFGIPLGATISLLSAGALSIIGYGALRVAAKKSKVANEYLKDIHLKKSHAFLESNLNDLAGGLLLLLMAATFLKFSMKSIIIGSLQYVGGILTIASGLYQLTESITAFFNAKKINNKEAILKATLNIIYSLIVLSFGIVMTIGMLNSPIGVILALGVGLLTIAVASLSLKKSAKQLKDINKIDENNALKIIKFLKNNLSLDSAELKKVKEKNEAMKKDDCLTWIKNNINNFEEKQKAKWKEIEEKLKIASDNEVEEIKKLILREEIKNAQERKIENFGALIKKDTLIKTLEILETSIDDETKIKAIFQSIKKDIKNKTIAEFIKIFIVNIPMIFIPIFQPLMNFALYDVLLSSTFFLNLSINLNPGFRNVPPTMAKKVLDINKKLNAYPISKDTQKATVKKVKKAAKKSIKKVA